ncbi:zinc finger BED domain-containing protein 4-like [Oscarella lobularis]|uniref:zinc finger BED domain-containing protein 4-like n=1 Tax=Oscarella lobularis TaxID=121494 RepID=UPI00331318C8
MMKHLKSKHLSEYQVVIAEQNADKQAEPASKQPTLPATLKRSVTYDSESFRKRKIDDALIKMIALDLQPASVVEDTGFRHLVHTLDPRYQLPSRRSLMRSQLPDLYDKIKANLKERISKVQFCSITTDLWTSRTTESYITVTCHFVEEWVLRCKGSEKLKTLQQQMNLPQHKLVQDVDTRWNSSYYMLERMIEQYEAVSSALCMMGKKDLTFDEENLQIMKEAVALLRPFEQATVEALPFIRESAETAQQRLLAEMNLVPRVMEKTTARTSFVDHTIELREYLHTKNLPRNENPLLWWKSHIIQFPVLSKMAEKYLSMAGTSVPSERSFSAAGQLISERRSRLKPENVNMYLFLHKNLKLLDHQ